MLFGAHPNHPNPISIAVPNEKRSIVVHKNTMRPRELAGERTMVLPISTDACARNEFNGSARDSDHPDGMAFGIGQVNIPVRPHREAFWPGKLRFFRRPPIASESLFAGAGDVMNRA